MHSPDENLKYLFIYLERYIVESAQLSIEVKIGKLFRRYWRVRIPSRVRRGARSVMLDVEGGRYLVEPDKHGRIYVPVSLRPFFDRAKTIVIYREGDAVVLKPRAY